MNIRFSIGRRIGFGFGIIILSLCIVVVLITGRFDEFRDIRDEIENVHRPSNNALFELEEMILTSEKLINNWVFIQSKEDVDDKRYLNDITKNKWPYLRKKIDSLSLYWEKDEQASLQQIFFKIDTLFIYHQKIKDVYHSLASYGELETVFGGYNEMLEEGGKIYDQSAQIRKLLSNLIDKRLSLESDQMEAGTTSFDRLELYLWTLMVILVISSVVIAGVTVRSIVKPVHRLRDMLLSIGKGIAPKLKMKPMNDEIGEMGVALNNVIVGMERTTEFSRQVGVGNFEFEHTPLSDRDTLGIELIKMRDSLAENERVLEQKVIERTEEVVKQKEEIEIQKQKLEELYKDVTDSIRYAKHIQDSILPTDSFIGELLPESFVFFKPKDIVSGDFYWFDEVDEKVIFAAVDSTGHGVPGAFMSLVGHNALNQAVKVRKNTKPSDILDSLNAISSKALNKEYDENDIRDGMDLAMCSLDKKTLELEFSGANNPLYVIRDGELKEVKPDKFAICSFEEGVKSYANHKVQLQKGDMIYIFSDGFPDQFGGEKGKKFLYRRFRTLLSEISKIPLSEQKDRLNETLIQWTGELKQLDDILVIGVRV